MDDIRVITAVLGTIIGSLGFLYGLLKDRQVKGIERRSKGPHFVPIFMRIDASGKSIPNKGKPYYSYRQERAEIDGHLFQMERYEASVPDDYPDNRVVALVAKNEGSKIRFFRTDRGEVRLQKHDFDDHYEFRYFLKKTEFGKVISVKVMYETEAGIQGTQIWSLEKGRLFLTRLKPKAV